MRNFLSKTVVVITCALVTSDLPARGQERVWDWPQLDLSKCETVFVEDARVDVPALADSRQNKASLEAVSKRFADCIAFAVDRDAFSQVVRRAPAPGVAAAIVRVRIKQYQPNLGNQAGKNPVNPLIQELEMRVEILIFEGTEKLIQFAPERVFKSELSAAKEIAAFVSVSRGIDKEKVLSRMKRIDRKLMRLMAQ